VRDRDRHRRTVARDRRGQSRSHAQRSRLRHALWRRSLTRLLTPDHASPPEPRRRLGGECALHMATVCRMRLDPRTRAYVARRRADGLSKREIIRCSSGTSTREIFQLLRVQHLGLDTHESFQGCQYTSLSFGQRCREMGVRPSMGSVEDAYDCARRELLRDARMRAARLHALLEPRRRPAGRLRVHRRLV
jgi:hypothetical protein